MPLRDHFRPPLEKKNPWNQHHAMWPGLMVQHLYRLLPPGFTSAPNVQLGKDYNIDIGVLDQDERFMSDADSGAGGTATTVLVDRSPTMLLETELPEQDEFEVLIYDAEQGQQLVAAIELVSPANKDRPENRRAFVGKVAALLQKDVCVSIVDVVTTKQFNIYAELLAFIDRRDPAIPAEPPPIYAVTLKGRTRFRRRSQLLCWYDPMTLGLPLPTLPIRLTEDQRIVLPLEESYEETCKFLHIR